MVGLTTLRHERVSVAERFSWERGHLARSGPEARDGSSGQDARAPRRASFPSVLAQQTWSRPATRHRKSRRRNGGIEGGLQIVDTPNRYSEIVLMRLSRGPVGPAHTCHSSASRVHGAVGTRHAGRRVHAEPALGPAEAPQGEPEHRRRHLLPIRLRRSTRARVCRVARRGSRLRVARAQSALRALRDARRPHPDHRDRPCSSTCSRSATSRSAPPTRRPRRCRPPSSAS